MNNVEMKIWGRVFDLEVYFKTYSGSGVTEEQKNTLSVFLDSDEIINGSKDKVITFIEDNYNDQLNGEKIENIFKYVVPSLIYVPQNNKKMIAILCNFRFDIEHGLAVVFENGTFKSVVLQDAIL